MVDKYSVTTVNSAYTEHTVCNCVSKVSLDVFWEFKGLTLHTNCTKTNVKERSIVILVI